MDFVDWRKSPDKVKINAESAESAPGRRRGKHFRDYVEEQIREAQERGAFSNLPGEGKPLKLDDDSSAGDRATGYHLLKNNGLAPAEVELAKEIRTARERAEAKLAKIVHQSKTLRARRVPPFPSERRAFNIVAQNAATEYERTLRELNRKILTLNLMAPSPMHQPFIEVERLVQEFREACPIFESSGS